MNMKLFVMVTTLVLVAGARAEPRITTKDKWVVCLDMIVLRRGGFGVYRAIDRVLQRVCPADMHMTVHKVTNNCMHASIHMTCTFVHYVRRKQAAPSGTKAAHSHTRAMPCRAMPCVLL